MNCAPCAHADEFHHWGQPGTHCRKCHRSWTSLTQAHCPTCCAHFSTPSLFDKHLTTRGCENPATVTKKSGEPVFRLDESGMWRSAIRWDGPIGVSGPSQSEIESRRVAEDSGALSEPQISGMSS